jgi:uncharacterized phage protein (TIGR02218 family)
LKTLSGGLTAHLLQDVTTLATCWKVTLRDGTVLAYTDHVSDLVIGGLIYIAALGYNASAIQTTAGTEVDNLELLGVLDPSAVAAQDINAGRWDFAAVEIFRVNYLDLTQGTDPLRKGTLGEVRHGATQYTADLMGMAQKLTQRIGRVYAPGCDADLGDARCKMDLAAFTNGIVAFTLTAVTSNRHFADSALSPADGWFDGGLITFTSGLNQGLSREVKTYTAPGVLELQEAMPWPVAVGDTGNATVGCLKRYIEDCSAKFDNALNFRGYPTVPGLDRLVGGI